MIPNLSNPVVDALLDSLESSAVSLKESSPRISGDFSTDREKLSQSLSDFSSARIIAESLKCRSLQEDTDRLWQLLYSQTESRSTGIDPIDPQYQARLRAIILDISEVQFSLKRAQSAKQLLTELETSNESPDSSQSTGNSLKTPKATEYELRESLGLNKQVGKSQESTETGQVSGSAKVHLNQSLQEEITQDLLEMATTLKQSSLIFQEKLQQDKDVLGATEAALDKSFEGISRIGSKLAAYQQSGRIGFWFYLWAVVFLVFSVVASMMIIKLFPKWG